MVAALTVRSVTLSDQPSVKIVVYLLYYIILKIISKFTVASPPCAGGDNPCPDLSHWRSGKQREVRCASARARGDLRGRRAVWRGIRRRLCASLVLHWQVRVRGSIPSSGRRGREAQGGVCLQDHARLAPAHVGARVRSTIDVPDRGQLPDPLQHRFRPTRAAVSHLTPLATLGPPCHPVCPCLARGMQVEGAVQPRPLFRRNDRWARETRRFELPRSLGPHGGLHAVRTGTAPYTPRPAVRFTPKFGLTLTLTLIARGTLERPQCRIHTPAVLLRPPPPNCVGLF